VGVAWRGVVSAALARDHEAANGRAGTERTEHTHIYKYIYIYTERERERESVRLSIGNIEPITRYNYYMLISLQTYYRAYF